MNKINKSGGFASRVSGVLFGLALAMAQPLQAAEFAGVVQFSDYSTLSAQVSGTVSRVKVSPGQIVDKGAVLVSLDGGAYQAAYEASKAAVTVSENALEVAERERERAEELYDRGSLSDHDLKLAVNAHAAAEGALLKAKAKQAKAALKARYSVVRAPMKSRVLDVLAHPGQVVVSRMSAQPLVVVAAADRFRIRVPVRAEQFNSTELGTAISATVGSKNVQGVVSAVAYEANEQSPYAVYVSVDLADGESIPLGETATVDLP
ncbi:MAG: efflux RND transporter periplasmic adaptor subunit [Gammaproteobacteria bacterium]